MPSLTEMVSILNGERRLQDGEFAAQMRSYVNLLVGVTHLEQKAGHSNPRFHVFSKASSARVRSGRRAPLRIRDIRLFDLEMDALASRVTRILWGLPSLRGASYWMM